MLLKLTKQVEFFSARSTLFSKLYQLYYKNKVRKEVNLANISCSDKVLCIGGGPTPFTAIEIVKQSGAKVTIVDNDINAINTANELINRLGMNDSINLVLSDGRDVRLKYYTIVHVALQVHPKKDIINHICQNAEKYTKILVRTSDFSFNNNLYGIKTNLCQKDIDCVSANFNCLKYRQEKLTLFINKHMSSENEENCSLSSWNFNNNSSTIDFGNK